MYVSLMHIIQFLKDLPVVDYENLIAFKNDNDLLHWLSTT